MKNVFWKSVPAAATAITILAGSAISASAQDVPEGVTAYQVEAAFEDVRFDLENAIVNRGLVIDYVSHIGTMLERTGEDVGFGLGGLGVGLVAHQKRGPQMA